MDATVTVTAAEEVGPNTVAIRFDTPEGFSAEPGQFIKLSAEVGGDEHARFYTLSSPDTEGTFELTIGYDPEEGGPFSEHIVNLEPGDGIEMSGPFGADYYEGEDRVVVLAGGPGVGPAVGIAERAIEDGNDAAVVYRDDVFAHEARLDALAEGGVPVRYVAADDDGAFTDAVAAVVTGEPDEGVFVYGFADFVDDAVEAVDAAGGDADAAKVENFG